MNLTELEKFVLLLRDGLNENIKVFSGDIAYLMKNYAAISEDIAKLISLVKKMEETLSSQKRAIDELKLERKSKQQARIPSLKVAKPETPKTQTKSNKVTSKLKKKS